MPFTRIDVQNHLHTVSRSKADGRYLDCNIGISFKEG